MHGPKVRSAVTLAAAGFAYNLITAWIAFGLAGAGHGWAAGIYSAMFGAVLCPALGVAIALRETRLGPAILTVVVVGAVVANVSVYYLTDRIDGWGHVFGRVADAMPGWLAAWFVIWLLWQLVALNLLVWRWSATP